MRAIRRSLGAAILAALLLGLAPRTATACAIDNVASLLADGVPAMLTTSVPRGATPWAPFTVAQAIASGAPVRLAEAPADLARTLPPAVRAAPYRWAFGDGGTSLGHAVVHRYAHAGTYRLTVSGYDRGARRWFAFGEAVLRVVPADQVVGANLGYDALQGVIALSGVTWPVNGVIVVLVLVLLVRRTRGTVAGRSRRARPQLGVRRCDAAGAAERRGARLSISHNPAPLYGPRGASNGPI